MKKLLWMLVMVLCLVLAACGGAATTDPEAPAESPSDTVVTEPEGTGDEAETVEEVSSDEPTVAPAEAPSDEATVAPAEAPSDEPTVAPAEEPTVEPTVVPETEAIQGERWAGMITDVAMVALGDVRVSINGVETQSDANGNFELSAPVSADGRNVINAEKEGYLPVSIIHIGAATALLQFEFQPVEQFTVDPTQPIETEDSSGTQISIGANQLVDENGNPATGPLTLNMHTYDVTTQSMPGDMGGTNSDGEPVYMETEGVFFAEFTDDAGNEYNLAEEANAEISIPCEPRADEVLTVWYYEKATGLWREENTTVAVEDDRCSAEVGHFSFWNFDYEKSTPACVRLDIDPSSLAENAPVRVKAVLQTNPVSVRDLIVVEQTNVLINLPPNTDVQFFMPPDAATPFHTSNTGAPWGGLGTPAFPYDACRGAVTLTTPPTPGSLQGRVVNATNNQPIGGAQVCIKGTAQCATTDASGNYAIADVAAGQYVLATTATGYISVSDQPVTVTAGAPFTQDFALSPELLSGEVRIVLTWGRDPEDLDSHLWQPDGSHIDYDSKGKNIGGAKLDVDATNGYGPETITISQMQNGTYTYAVQHFVGDGTLLTSGAIVRVYRGSQEIAAYTAATLTGDGIWWHVFNMDGAGNLTPINTVSANPPQ